MTQLLLFTSHSGTALLGFALGIYLLPILVQPTAPDIAAVESTLATVLFTTAFERQRKDSDALHWGEGELRLYADTIIFEGKLAPGPDYRLYLTPEFVETEAAFLAIKQESVEIGAIKNFDRFVLNNASAVNDAQYTTAVVWCETFGQFITSGQYRP
ncbi:MAG: DM13 domain-containing protein [Luminiphilus sp.]|nr:DM13 domain-containing protein [Luminiphilus sp.]